MTLTLKDGQADVVVQDASIKALERQINYGKKLSTENLSKQLNTIIGSLQGDLSLESPFKNMKE